MFNQLSNAIRRVEKNTTFSCIQISCIQNDRKFCRVTTYSTFLLHCKQTISQLCNRSIHGSDRWSTFVLFHPSLTNSVHYSTRDRRHITSKDMNSRAVDSTLLKDLHSICYLKLLNEASSTWFCYSTTNQLEHWSSWSRPPLFLSAPLVLQQSSNNLCSLYRPLTAIMTRLIYHTNARKRLFKSQSAVTARIVKHQDSKNDAAVWFREQWRCSSGAWGLHPPKN